MNYFPYQDSHRPIAERIEDLLSRMTIEEKAGLMFHKTTAIGPDGLLDRYNQVLGLTIDPVETLITKYHMSHFNLVDSRDPAEIARWHNRVQELALQTRLGIPITISSDPRHTFTISNPLLSILAGHFSQWPESPGIAAIRDEQLVQRHADIVRQEYMAVGIRVALHPQIDLATEPRWVRVNGTFGEDAAHTSRIVRAYIRGLQGKSLGPHSVAAMVKHFPGAGPQRDGHDAHSPFGREQVYPGNLFDYHLQPFRAAIGAGCSQIMPYYAMPIDTKYEEVGFGFNKGIITGLLRQQMGFKGIVCSDWGLITDSSVGGAFYPARAWGVEDLSRIDRVQRAIEAGVDQFGGEKCPELVAELVQSGKISEQRIDTSVRRLLREKFLLGLFDNRYVNVEAAERVVGSADFVTAGLEAQRASVTVLKKGNLPLSSTSTIYVENAEHAIASKYAALVDDPDDADAAIIRLKMPAELHGESRVDQWSRAVSLELPATNRARITSLTARVPTIVDVYLDRPYILTEILGGCDSLVANYGASDTALFDVLFGKSTPHGRLPFDLPSSMYAVEQSRSDVPFDTEHPLFRFGYGLTL